MIRELKCKTSPQSLAEDYSFPARPGTKNIFPQQHKLMGSSAQNSCGVHWCRHRVRFNEVPEKVPKVPEKVWDLVQRQVRFNRVREIQRRFQEARVQSQVRFNRFNRVAEKVPEKVWEAPGQVEQGQVRFQQVQRVSSAWFRSTRQKDL